MQDQGQGTANQALQTKPDQDQHEPAQAEIGVLPLEQVGWTPEEAARVRAQLFSFVEDWDDPEMDAYDAL